MSKEERLFQSFVEKKSISAFFSKDEQPYDDDESSDEDEGEDESEDLDILGINSEIWTHVILSFYDVFEVLKFFDVSKSFYILSCLSLRNRNAKSNRVLTLVMEKNPSEMFLIQMIKWGCFDKILNNHILRHAVRKGYLEVTKYLCKNDGDCTIRDWIVDVLEQMILQLEKKKNRDDGLFEGYVELLNDFKNEIRWDSLSSPEAFNILCRNKDMHEYVKSKMSNQEIDYSNLFLVSCEYEYINNLEYFFKHGYQKYLSENTISIAFKKIMWKEYKKGFGDDDGDDGSDEKTNPNAHRIITLVSLYLPLTSIFKAFDAMIDRPSKFWMLRKIIESTKQRGHDINSQIREHIISKEYLLKLSDFRLFQHRYNYWDGTSSIDCKHQDKDAPISLFFQELVETFNLPKENYEYLAHACRNGNLPLFKYLFCVHNNQEKEQEKKYIVNDRSMHIFRTVCRFGLMKGKGKEAGDFSEKMVGNYLGILKLLVSDPLKRYDVTTNGSFEIYFEVKRRSLYYSHIECFQMVVRVMEENDERVKEIGRKNEERLKEETRQKKAKEHQELNRINISFNSFTPDDLNLL